MFKKKKFTSGRNAEFEYHFADPSPSERDNWQATNVVWVRSGNGVIAQYDTEQTRDKRPSADLIKHLLSTFWKGERPPEGALSPNLDFSGANFRSQIFRTKDLRGCRHTPPRELFEAKRHFHEAATGLRCH